MTTNPPRERGKAELAINELLGHTTVSRIFDQIAWADEEVKKAIKRHPEKADVLYHSFRLLGDGIGELETELLYRAFCHELLERVARGADVRPATNAELLEVCSKMSLKAPMTTGGTALYLRIWDQTFPDKQMADEHIDHVGGADADQLERALRRRLYRRDRRSVEQCDGQHWGEPAPTCMMKAKAIAS